jgi:hypothetical protein
MCYVYESNCFPQKRVIWNIFHSSDPTGDCVCVCVCVQMSLYSVSVTHSALCKLSERLT